MIKVLGLLAGTVLIVVLGFSVISVKGDSNISKIGDGNVSETEFGYLNGVSSALQTQIDTKSTGDMSKSVYDVAENDSIDADKIDSGLEATLIGEGTVSDKEFSYLSEVTSDI